MPSFLQRFLPGLTAIILLCPLFADTYLATAAVLPPETVPTEEKAVPSEIAPEAEQPSHPENPFEQSSKLDPDEALRRKRERTTIYIILGVVLLFCAYWWTSGKLHHRIPRMK